MMELVITTEAKLKEIISDALDAQSKEAEKQSQEGRLVDRKEAANILGVSQSTIDNFRRNNLIRSYRIKGTVRFNSIELIEDFKKA
jgi:predicted Zn-dependent peptidase